MKHLKIKNKLKTARLIALLAFFLQPVAILADLTNPIPTRDAYALNLCFRIDNKEKEPPIAPNTWKSGTVTVTLSSDGKTLTVAGNGPMADYCGDPHSVFSDSEDLQYCDRRPYTKTPRWKSRRDAPYSSYTLKSWQNTEITAVIIKEGVTHIGRRAFAALERLESVTIPGSVKSIGEKAFVDCESLESITLPEGLASIGGGAFWATGISSVNIPNSMASNWIDAFSSGVSTNISPDNAHYVFVDSVLFNRDKTALIQYPEGRSGAYTVPQGVKVIGERAFAGSLVTSVTISNGVTKIEKEAFSECGKLTSVTIPNSVASIGVSAFEWTGLTSVTIPGSVKSIGEGAFSFSGNLESVTMMDGVTSIGAVAFGWTGLTSITIPKSAASIGLNAFENYRQPVSIDVAPGNAHYSTENGILFNKNKSVLIKYPSKRLDSTYAIPRSVRIIGDKAFSDAKHLTSITIPNGVTSIGKNAFAGTEGLTSIIIPNSVTAIGEHAFAGSGLKSITIPNRVASIGEGAFANCKGLADVIISNGVKTIGDGAFARCEKLESITIPGSVKSIGKMAFYDCALSSVTIADGVASIGDSAFFNCDELASINIPRSVSSIGEYAFGGWNSLASIDVAANNAHYSSGGGVLFNKNKTVLISYPRGRPGASYSVPRGVLAIGNGAFFGSESLITVTLPAGVISIGESAFAGCENLKSVNIPGSVAVIGKMAFAYCESLKSVNIPNRITAIEEMTFVGCENLRFIKIPNSVTSIEARAFAGCDNVEHVTIGRRVAVIEWGAFIGCYRLKSVTSLNPVPPKTGRFAFKDDDDDDDRRDGPSLRVPASALEAYQSAKGWGAGAAFKRVGSLLED